MLGVPGRRSAAPILILASLVLAACGGSAVVVDGPLLDAQIDCPDPDPPVDAKLPCHMVLFLVQAGFTEAQIVTDGLTLLPPKGEDLLVQKGFQRKPATGTTRAIYELGDSPTLHTDGQRVTYDNDGSITFLTFASANHGFLETIFIDADGVVQENTVMQLP